MAALAAIANGEGTTVMELLREAARAIVRERAALPEHLEKVQTVIWRSAPQMPKKFKTVAQLARFKRAQREFDQVLLDLQIAAPAELQARNSIVPSRGPVRLVNFDRAHATSV